MESQDHSGLRRSELVSGGNRVDIDILTFVSLPVIPMVRCAVLLPRDFFFDIQEWIGILPLHLGLICSIRVIKRNIFFHEIFPIC